MSIEGLAKLAAAYNSTSRSPVAALISGGQVIEFHNPRNIYGEPIIFPAFLTAFNDSVAADFTETVTYGRMDPIYSFKNTKRQITFSIDIPSESVDVAKDNLSNVKKLQSLLYPSYASDGGHHIISTAPLFQIRFNNLINDELGPGGRLLGVIPSLDFAPEVEPGMFFDGSSFYPKLLKLNVTFNPLHAGAARGFDETGLPLSAFTDTGAPTANQIFGSATGTDANSGVQTNNVASAVSAKVTDGTTTENFVMQDPPQFRK